MREGCRVGQGLAPAQQPQPPLTKKEKSRELTAARRNACASVRSSVRAVGQLGSAKLSPPTRCCSGGGRPITPTVPTQE